ncbi:MAG: hypothetical protein OXF95_07720 [Rhodobacteraceae bacterium]|nr:hypothetical protein [Paracoccaceae bacterium]
MFQSIFEGLVIGTGAGLTTAILIGLYSFTVNKYKRREQIGFIRNIVNRKMQEIISVQELEAPDKSRINPGTIRYAIYQSFQRELHTLFLHRSTKLKYHEKYSIELILENFDGILKNLTLEKSKFIPLEFAEKLQEEFMALKWLGMPKKRGKRNQ